MSGSTSRCSCQALGNCGIAALHCRSGSTCPWPIARIGRLARFFSSTLRWIIRRSRAYYWLSDWLQKLCLSISGLFLDPLSWSLSYSCESIRFKTRCWPAPVSSLIQVNRESLGTSRASTANRKHCLVNNTNGGHCHSPAGDRQPCCLRRAPV